MKGGEEADVKCPNELDLGGQIKNGWSSKYKAGQPWLNHKIDTKYHLIVDECSSNPHYFSRNDHVETL